MAVAILIEQAAQQTTTQAPLLLHPRLLLAQHLAQAAGVHAARAHALRQKRHHDGRQHLQQLPGIGAQPRGLAQAGLGTLLVAPKNVAQDGRAIGLAAPRAAAAAQQRTEQTAQIRAAAVVALQAGCEVAQERIWQVSRVPFDQRLRSMVGEAATDLGLPCLDMVSGASHDMIYIAQVVPGAMIFVPSIGGRSHAEAENTTWQDCAAGTDVLLQCLIRTGNEPV